MSVATFDSLPSECVRHILNFVMPSEQACRELRSFAKTIRRYGDSSLSVAASFATSFAIIVPASRTEHLSEMLYSKVARNYEMIKSIENLLSPLYRVNREIRTIVSSRILPEHLACVMNFFEVQLREGHSTAMSSSHFRIRLKRIRSTHGSDTCPICDNAAAYDRFCLCCSAECEDALRTRLHMKNPVCEYCLAHIGPSDWDNIEIKTTWKSVIYCSEMCADDALCADSVLDAEEASNIRYNDW
jgi:hypothetical protein